MSKKIIVIVGTGKGLGNHIGMKFGHEGFTVVLMARNGESLKTYEQEFAAEGIETYVHEADAAAPESLTVALDWVKEKLGTPDVLVYNVGITGMDDPNTMNNAELMRHYQIDVTSAYHCVQKVVTEEFANKKGAILFTGGGLAMYPFAQFIPLSLDKAALRTLSFILHDDLKSKGIFVGTVTVCGTIGIDAFFAPARIAEAFWNMYLERNTREVVYEYPELKGTSLNASDYWAKVYALKGSKGE